MNTWDQTVLELKERAQGMHEAREAALGHCRKLGQLAARSIRHVHRHQFDEAENLLEQAKQAAEAARASLRPFPELNPAYLHDSEKEMVEAAAVLAIVRGLPYPTPQELGAQVMSYLNGMGEAASEVRRFALDSIRHGKVEEAEAILGQMEMIYEDLITFDFSDAMTGGLRRTCDALRAVVERTRSDLTLTTTQQALTEELRRYRLGENA
ncbi:COG2178 Predicted RNA-binding protein of the translin family [Fimbriimonadaceae bacterium]